MKNVKWSFVLLLIAIAVVSGVSQGCSSDEYDESIGLKTMARRKASTIIEKTPPKQDPDTTGLYIWAALDTVVTRQLRTAAVIQFRIQCNEGFSNEIVPSVTVDTINGRVYCLEQKCYIANNGRVYCEYSWNEQMEDCKNPAGTLYDYFYVQLKRKILALPQ